ALEHFTHLGILPEQLVYFLDAGSRAARDAFAPAAVDDLVVVAFVLGHGIDDGLDPHQFLLVHLVGYLLHSLKWSDAWQNLDDALQRTQPLNLPELIAEILQRETIAGERFLGKLLGLLLVNALFRALDERKNIAHAQDAPHDAVGMERLQGIRLFANADELNWLAGYVPDRKRRAAARVAIHLGQHNPCERQLFVELVGGAHRVLAGHGVGDEQDL